MSEKTELAPNINFNSYKKPQIVKPGAAMNSFLFFFLSLFSVPSFAVVGTITPTEANKLIASTDPKTRPLVLDTRGGYKDYFRGHLPTAHHINFDTLRGTDAGVPVQYLPDSITKELLTRAGVDKNRTHILYAEGGTGDEVLSATMVAYVLEKFGVKDIRIIDGGLPAYKSKFETTQAYPKTPKGALPSKMDSTIGVNVNYVLANKDKENVVLIDARPNDEYLGKDEVWLRKGHIPGAVSFPWRNLVTADNAHKFKDPKDVEALLKKSGVTPDKDVIVYCGTSREGSLLRFYLKHIANYPKVRLYEGSWKEYASLEQYPVETTVPQATVR